jgi:hypothetical protein
VEASFEFALSRKQLAALAGAKIFDGEKGATSNDRYGS